MTTAPPPTASDLLATLDWEVVRCYRCGAVVGESAISGGHARFKCRHCKKWTTWPWRARGMGDGRSAARVVRTEVDAALRRIEGTEA